jgi:hypothetical protein
MCCRQSVSLTSSSGFGAGFEYPDVPRAIDVILRPIAFDISQARVDLLRELGRTLDLGMEAVRGRE